MGQPKFSGAGRAPQSGGTPVHVEDSDTAIAAPHPYSRQKIAAPPLPLTPAELSAIAEKSQRQKEQPKQGRQPGESATWRRVVRGWIDDLLSETSADHHPRWGGGDISPSSYETAWVAMIRDPRRPERLAFPEALGALVAMQQSDGAWGGVSPYTMTPTLAALLALVKAPTQTPGVVVAQARAKMYLMREAPQWALDDIDTPFFEFLAPALANELGEHGFITPLPGMELMLQRRDEKLARLPLHLLSSGRSPLIHVLEALGPILSNPQIAMAPNSLAPNGCFGCSPAAAAAVLIYRSPWDMKAAQWLRKLTQRASGGVRGAMPTSHPADTFEAAWVLHLLAHGGVAIDVAAHSASQTLARRLMDSLTQDGASFAHNRALPPDADDTAVALTVLNRLGAHTDLAPLWTFLQDDHLITYLGERTASVSANAHALESVLSVDALGANRTLTRRRMKLVDFVLAQRNQAGFWRDKWHISSLYATLSCVLALANAPEHSVRRTLEPTLRWTLDAQEKTGCWRLTRASSAVQESAASEETAYGVLTLRALQRALAGLASPRLLRAATQQIRRGQAWLAHHATNQADLLNLPAMYVDKSLYTPYRVVRAAILAALSVAS